MNSHEIKAIVTKHASVVCDWLHNASSMYRPFLGHLVGGKDAHGLNWKSIEKTFRDEFDDNGLLLDHQSLSFKTYEVEYSDCLVLAFWRYEELYRAMLEARVDLNIKTYTALVHGYAKAEMPKKARDILNEMKKKSIKLDLLLYGTIIWGIYKQNKIEEAEERGMEANVYVPYPFGNTLGISGLPSSCSHSKADGRWLRPSRNRL
ncbi:hypothetical protein K1719_026256 [Acacia pycnantha]|nr:hypothetical protein K1719_026256 [Acacia pycnantha]